MKIRHLLMLQFILALFGCKKAPTITTVSSEQGPFTIETITEKGKTYNMNYGRVNYTTISYAVKYKGEPLQINGELETNTGLPGIWRVFSLKDAPAPSLILGSQSLYLVTLEHEKPVIKPLFNQGSDFASIQWLDSEAGQPGIYREVYSSDEADTETELSGGRYMAITHAVVLDTKTFTVYPFNTNNEPVDGYYVGQREAYAFSPDSTQLVYCGEKNDEQDYTIRHLALVSYNFKNGQVYAVPFDADSFHLKDQFKITTGWVQDYFQWVKGADGAYKLQTRKFDKPPFRKGIIYYERYRGFQYILDPVKASMMDLLASYISTELNIDAAQQHRIEGDYLNRIYFEYNGITLMLIYGEYGADLVFKQEPKGMVFKDNKVLIERIGHGFNAILSSGKYQEEWETESDQPAPGQ